MDGAHRKIELQSPEDLTYLITNVRRAAAEHLSEAFPPVEGDDAGGDELRVRIEKIVDEVCVSCLFLTPCFVSLSFGNMSTRKIMATCQLENYSD